MWFPVPVWETLLKLLEKHNLKPQSKAEAKTKHIVKGGKMVEKGEHTLK